MTDQTEAVRRVMIDAKIPEADLAEAGQRWDTDALRQEFEVTGFLAPFVMVRRRADGVKGSLEFTHSPRFYFNFRED